MSCQSETSVCGVFSLWDVFVHTHTLFVLMGVVAGCLLAVVLGLTVHCRFLQVCGVLV